MNVHKYDLALCGAGASMTRLGSCECQLARRKRCYFFYIHYDEHKPQMTREPFDIHAPISPPVSTYQAWQIEDRAFVDIFVFL